MCGGRKEGACFQVCADVSENSGGKETLCEGEMRDTAEKSILKRVLLEDSPLCSSWSLSAGAAKTKAEVQDLGGTSPNSLPTLSLATPLLPPLPAPLAPSSPNAFTTLCPPVRTPRPVSDLTPAGGRWPPWGHHTSNVSLKNTANPQGLASLILEGMLLYT